jgi:hypothetical protein
MKKFNQITVFTSLGILGLMALCGMIMGVYFLAITYMNMI